MRLQMSDGVPVVVEEFTLAPAAVEHDLPIVLLHGLSQQRHYWRPVIDRMRGGRVITIDQRGHGDATIHDDGTEVSAETDFRMDRLAADVIEVLDALGVAQAIVVGHSWGASVALHTATAHPTRVRACALIDGGLFGPRHLVGRVGTHEEVREALRPPPLGMMQPVLWEAIASGDLSPYWSSEIKAALEPTFRSDETGRVFTRVGMDRHMAVLAGLFEYDSRVDIPAVACPVWVVVCDPRVLSADGEPDASDPMSQAWDIARQESIADLPAPFFVQRWHRALHDVPLQWPALVAGLLETIAERTRA